MTPKKTPLKPSKQARATVAEMDQWRAAIRDLPETRKDKISRGRTRVRSSSYEDDLILDATAERMREELGL